MEYLPLYLKNSNDSLVRGNIKNNYHHGWVEFQFEGEEYVFDSKVKGIVSRQEWYEKFKPIIDYKKTQKEILQKYLNEKYAFKMVDGFWQFKYIVMDSYTEDTSYKEVYKYDKENGHIPSALMLARVVVNKFDSEIIRFIAYTEPSG